MSLSEIVKNACKELHITFRELAYAKELERIKNDLLYYGCEFDSWISERWIVEQGMVDDAIKKMESMNLLYEKDGDVYFCRPEAVFRDVEVEEKYRRIGRGSINSVEWASQRHLVYIDDCMVYRINSRELYTLGLYSGIIGQGTPIGRLPFQFNEIHRQHNKCKHSEVAESGVHGIDEC